MEGNLTYEWEVPKDWPNFSGYDDLPEAYRVYESDTATSGVIIEAKFNGKWSVNPWNTRTLVKHLLEDLGRTEAILKSLKEDIEDAALENKWK